MPSTAVGLARHGDDYLIRLDAGGELAARTVIIATGVTYRQLDAAGLDRFAESVVLDNNGFIVTGPDLSGQARDAPAWEEQGRDPYLLEASLPGVFAVGDVRSGSVKRVASAAGEGSIAIRFASEHLGRRAGVAAASAAART